MSIPFVPFKLCKSSTHLSLANSEFLRCYTFRDLLSHAHADLTGGSSVFIEILGLLRIGIAILKT
jgi:hypothetical protein